MNRTLINLIIDILSALLLMGMIATGYLLRFPLPPGSNKSLSLWGFTRHQWGDFHFWISLGLLLVMVVHIVLHWNWIVTVIGKRCNLLKSSQPSLVRSGILTACVFILSSILFAWTAQNNVKEIALPMRGKALNPNIYDRSSSVKNLKLNRVTQENLEFWKDVYPIFENNCQSCHGPQKQSANFRVDRKEDWFGMNRGSPLILPGNSSLSPIMAIVSGTKKTPFSAFHTLSERNLELLKAWIDSGAKWNEK